MAVGTRHRCRHGRAVEKGKGKKGTGIQWGRQAGCRQERKKLGAGRQKVRQQVQVGRHGAGGREGSGAGGREPKAAAVGSRTQNSGEPGRWRRGGDRCR